MLISIGGSMNEKRISLFGEKDQQLLFRAFAHYVARTTKKSINIIIGMIHVCIQEAAEKHMVSLQEARILEESKRKELLETGIDEFLKKTKVSNIHRSSIKQGCMSIYEKWRDIRASIIHERDIHLSELLSDPSSNIIGYDDQEVLLNAFTHYITRLTGSPRSSVAKLIRVCMLEVTIPRRINFKEARYLDESTRKELIIAGINEFIKRIQITDNRADIIMADCLKVYERWKEIRRDDPDKEEYNLEDLCVK